MDLNKELLLSNIEKIHTTELGLNRIKKNIKINDQDVVEYCKRIILETNCMISRRGKNWYCKNNNIIVTINARSYTIITAHLIRR